MLCRVTIPGRKSPYIGQFLGHDGAGNRMVKTPKGKVRHYRAGVGIQEVVSITNNPNDSGEATHILLGDVLK